MSSKIKSIAQYVIVVLATCLLVWLSLRGLQSDDGEDKLDFLIQTWKEADKGWLLAMAAISMVSHVLRAERWRMLFVPVNYSISSRDSFLSLMVGYLVNLVIPRGGEVSRCYNLYKLDKTPVDVAFGTVVVERIVDLLCLLLLILLSFVFEYQKLMAFIDTLTFSASGGNSRLTFFLYVLLSATAAGLLFYWLFQRNQKFRAFVIKSWIGFKGGLGSVFRLRQKRVFIAYSIGIWFLYYVMSYAVIKAFPATSTLGFSAVLSLFAIGAIAMAAPLPGGTGSYHVLVPQGLVLLYGIPKTEAVAFTFIFHGWQTAILILGGAISVIVTSILVKKSSRGDARS